MKRLLVLYVFFAFVMAVKANGFTVVIDPGHGGHDPGAVGRFAKEKNINLSTAIVLGRLIKSSCPNVNVIFTRTNDTFVTLEGRARIANKAKADLFISIHTNALPKGKIGRGAETYTLGMARVAENLEVAKRENSAILIENDYESRYQGFDPRSSESYIIFEMMQDQNMAQSVQFAKSIQTQFRAVGRNDKGVHQAGFLVLRATTMPSVLVELGYISTPDEESFLSSAGGAETMGRAIFNAFMSYYKLQTGGARGAIDIKKNEVQTDVSKEESVESNVSQNENNDASHEPQTFVNNISAQNQQSSALEPAVEFRVQFMTSGAKLKSVNYAGVYDVDYYREGVMYKYTSGHFNTRAEAQSHRNKLAHKFPGCFVIKLVDGKREK